MAKVTIIPGFNQVYVDGECHTVEVKDLPDDVHAIQWDNETNTGEVEYIKKPNRKITSLDEITEPMPAPKARAPRVIIQEVLARHKQESDREKAIREAPIVKVENDKPVS